MSEDLSFNKIIVALKDIHKAHPDMRFGQVLQAALDEKTGLTNVDFHDRSSKEIHTSLVIYQSNVIKRRERKAKGQGGKK